MNENQSFRESNDGKVVLFIVDAEKGEGVQIAKNYRVSGYPNFILTTAEGEIYDRWLGYGDPDQFTATLAAATENPITISQRRRQFREEPNVADAEKIGELEGFGGYYGEAMAWYQRAEDLGSETYLAPAKLELVARGSRSGLYGDEDVMKVARVVLKSKLSTPPQVAECVSLIDRGTRDREDRGEYIEVLKLAAKSLKKVKGEEDQRYRAAVMVEYSLHVKNKPTTAYEWKLKSMAADWMEDGSQLNSVAWWCFENNIALDEAEEFARKGVELTEGTTRANVMDTLAEICNAKGDCGEALELIRAALAINPDNEYFQKQLVRFEELLKEQQG